MSESESNQEVNEETQQEESKDQRPIVLIDGLNTFLRFFCANPTVSASGEPIGGVVGFINFLDWILRNLTPQKICVIWEKGGGSSKRKVIYPEYKANRAKITELEEVASKPKSNKMMDNPQSKQKQLLMLVEILKHLPICQIYHAECECDDVLAYLVKQKFVDQDIPKIIVSSDKDFYQLLDRPDVKIYDHGKKIFVECKDVIEKFGIHPKNFVLARTVDGDDSDNINGIKGVGIKTLLKVIPEIGNHDVEMDVNSLIELSHKKLEENPKSKALQEIVSGQEIIKRNWKLMYLGLGTIQASQAIKINSTVDFFKPKYDHLNFLKSLQKSEIVLPVDFHSMAQNLKIYLL